MSFLLFRLQRYGEFFKRPPLFVANIIRFVAMTIFLMKVSILF